MSRLVALVAVVATVVPAVPAAVTDPGRVAGDLDRLLAQERVVRPPGKDGTGKRRSGWLPSGDRSPRRPTSNYSDDGRIDDGVFLRRVTLDVIGELPSPAAITAFVLDTAATKRSAMVDQLLADPRYGTNWARYWRDVILSRRSDDRALLVARPLVSLMTEAFNGNVAWDAVARQFITATGDIRQQGSTAIFVAQQARTEETTGEMCRILLGIQIQCAQCHDHPTDRWTREQFHRLAAFFPRVALRPVRNVKPRTFLLVGVDRQRRRRRAVPANGRRASPEHYMRDFEHPRDPGTLMTPTFFLTGDTVPLGTSDAERRATLARWLTSNPWFAKAYVNRMWTELVGWGFFESVDDLGPDHSPFAPRTLDLLTQQFVASGYDTKWLMRTVMATRAYQAPNTSEDRAAPRQGDKAWQRLRADQLFDAIIGALEIDEPRGGRGATRRRPGRPRRGPRGQFVSAFGYDPSTPRGALVGSIPQALVLMNSPQIARHIRAAHSRTMLGRLLDSTDDDRAVIEELYLRCLARPPRASERAVCLDYLRHITGGPPEKATDRPSSGKTRARTTRVPPAASRRAAFEDILWALINSAEFLHRT